MSTIVCLHLPRLVVVATLLLLLTTAVWAQGTAFTYQSRLNDNGALANGSYDMQFSLFDAVNGGAQIGATLDKPNIAIANGVFIVQLDFGANAFSNGGQRFLQIAVRPAGTSDPYTEMSPRTEITSTPYAIRSLSAASADNATQLNGVAAGNYVKTDDARLSDARDPKPGSTNYIQNTTTPQVGNFNLSGSGIVSDTLSAGVVNATTQFNLGGTRILSSNSLQQNVLLGIDAGKGNVTNTRNTFIGHGAGLATTTGMANSFLGTFAGSGNTTGTGNTMIGDYTGTTAFTGSFNTSIGAGSKVGANSFNATALGAQAFANCSNCTVVSGDVGLGTNIPQERLHVANGNVRWGNALLFNNQGGSIELGGTNTVAGTGTPYIDFHYNGQTVDYNVRLINDQPNRLSVIGALNLSGPLTSASSIVTTNAIQAAALVSTGNINAIGTIFAAGKIGTNGGFNGRCLNGSLGSSSFNTSFGNACNMDLAESFRTLQRTEPGDVVTLLTQDRDKPTVRKAHRAYDAQLIGVVSTNPGLIFDEGQTHLAGDNTQHITKDKTAVAMVGRVPVKFTLENGAIKVGDALTSSATEPGKAMKATSAGKIIGIALESSDKAKDGKLLMWLQIGHHEPTTATVAGRPLSRKRQGAALVTLKHENTTLKNQLDTVLGQLKSVTTRLDELERNATQTNTDAHNH